MWLPSHPTQGLTIQGLTVCDNLVLYHMHNYVRYNSYIYDLSVLIFERRKTGAPGEKPSKHRRDQLRQLNSHGTQVQAPTRLSFFPVVRGIALIATRASLMV